MENLGFDRNSSKSVTSVSTINVYAAVVASATLTTSPPFPPTASPPPVPPPPPMLPIVTLCGLPRVWRLYNIIGTLY